VYAHNKSKPEAERYAGGVLGCLSRARIEKGQRNRTLTFLKGDSSPATIQFGELDDRARRIAGALKRAGAAGERALLVFPPGLEFIAAFFGCLYAGTVAVPLYPPRRAGGLNARLQAVADDCAARFVLSSRAVLDDAMRALHRSGDAEPVGIATDAIGAGSEHWAQPQIDFGSLAFLQYTSGSTGAPKGVMVTHGSLAATLEDMDQAYRHRSDSLIVSWLPLFHDLGLIYGALQPVFSGCSGVLLPPVSFLQRPLRWLKAITDYRATHSAAPNFAYELCVRRITAEDKVGLDLSSWEVSLNAAEPVREETMRRFVQCFAPCGLRPHVVSAGYGLAEATLKVTSVDNGMARRTLRVNSRALSENRVVPLPHDQPGQDVCSCGRTHIGSRIVIVNPDTCCRCAADGVGEIWVQGRAIAAGYFRRPAESAATFEARLADSGEGPFLRTGDLGFLADGELYVTGRLSDMIIVRGQNHYPHDIEMTVQQSHPALAPDCGAAFGLEEDGEERLVVVNEIGRRSLRDLDAEAVFTAIRRAVAEEHELQVHAIVLLQPSTLAKTSSGKVMRRACRAGFTAGTLDAVAVWRHGRSERAADHAAATISPDEASIRLWLRLRVAALAGLPENAIDCGEPLNCYGIDSMSLVSLSGELGDWIGRSLPATLFYDRPSIDATARYLAGRQPAQGRAGLSADGPVAVVGLACRFPGGENAQAFWQLLCAKRDAVAAMPPGRGPLGGAGKAPLEGYFLPRVDLFDAAFFGIARREAERMDPQQRLVLEVAWEALENAAVSPASLAGTRGGVFIGISTADYMRMQAGAFDGYTVTGNAFSIAANRLSYRLDLKGPSVAVDTACSSSLVAVHHASEALRRGDCDLALAGGVNLVLSPELSESLAKAGMLAADGRCKVFDASADGYGRGEGCGIVVLKRLEDAIASADNVLAVLCGTAVNQDGRSNGLTAPNGPAQQAVIRAALERAGARPQDVGWIECHGTGTLLGDPVEVGALAATLLDGRDPARPLRLTSVKANVGHLEAAAGITGFIKAVLALHHGVVPAQAGLSQINPNLAIEGTPIRIPVANEPWPAGDQFAGVSSFGFGGTNAHAILRAAPVATAAAERVFESPDVLCLSARDRAALNELARRYADFLSRTDLPLADICYTALAARSHFPCRLSAVADDAAEMQGALRGFAAGETRERVFIGDAAGEPVDSGGDRPAGSSRAAAVTAAARAYAAGQSPDAAALYGGGRRRAFLPNYPFQRQRYWFDGSRSPGGERRPVLTAEVARCFHRAEWKESPVVERALPESVSDVLIFGDERGVGTALAGMLQARLRRCYLVENGEGFARLSPASWRLDSTRPEQLARAVAEIVAGGRGVSDFVFLATSEDLGLAGDSMSVAALDGAQKRGTLALISVLQAALHEGALAPRIQIVTRGGVPLDTEAGAVNLVHAGAWGLLRTLLLEQPGLEAVAVDLGRDGASVQDEAVALLAELGASAGEDHVAWRGRRRLVGRLRRGAPAARRSADIAPDRCHLVTGALGEIGMRIVHWLVERGARDIVLTARRPPDEKTAGMLDRLRRSGAGIEVVSVDVADEGGMAALFDRLDRAGRQLAGVMHLAGVRDDMLLPQVSAARFEAVLRPKVLGSWVLHRLTRNRELDYFVMFSSIASGFGAAGQSCYSAANAFLDALAHRRRADALPALSINWGPWSGGGMAETLSPIYLRRMGVGLLSPALGMQALEHAMACNEAQVMVCPFDWAAMKNNYPWVRRRRFLEEVDRPEQATSPARSADLHGDLDLEAILDEIRAMAPEGIAALIDRAAESVLP
jgi:acyl transferase domain-containing protein/acyl-CoA synthetase (AMP-forming)/AMP-acid ligase II/acyl carrier protein